MARNMKISTDTVVPIRHAKLRDRIDLAFLHTFQSRAVQRAPIPERDATKHCAFSSPLGELSLIVQRKQTLRTSILGDVSALRLDADTTARAVDASTLQCCRVLHAASRPLNSGYRLSLDEDAK